MEGQGLGGGGSGGTLICGPDKGCGSGRASLRRVGGLRELAVESTQTVVQAAGTHDLLAPSRGQRRHGGFFWVKALENSGRLSTPGLARSIWIAVSRILAA